MNKTLLLAGAATALFASHANALDYNQYVSAKLTYAPVSHDFKWEASGKTGERGFNDKVFGANVAYGVQSGSVRTELELNMKEDAEKVLKGKSGSAKLVMKNKFAMLNAYYDFNLCSNLTPYVGAGLGVAKLTAKEINQPKSTYITAKKNATNLAWQLGAGLAYALTDNFSVDLGYRFLNEGKVNYKDAQGVNKFESKSHEFSLGVRYSF